MRSLRTFDVTPKRRALSGLLAMLFIVSAIELSTAEPANAHNLGHSCTGKTSTGFSCVTDSWTDATNKLSFRTVDTYYNGTRRSTSYVAKTIGTNR